ncbi:Lipase maturation factor [Popillia japonica]|uniref:Lipase maturation factor n=1 Tax=Popillia japonica TaxID=7064 RepID=A0AAW1KKM5_POPJA
MELAGIMAQTGPNKTLNYFFETTVLPTPLSWYAHHIPTWILRLTTVFALVSEILLPFLFFVPVRSVRITGFVIQLFLQIAVYLTGNFNFLNLLITTMLITLLDDQFFFGKSRKNNESVIPGVFSALINIIFHGAIVYGVIVFYNIKFTGTQIEASVGFTRDQFNSIAKTGLLYSTYLGLASLGFTVARAIASCFLDANNKFLQKLLSFLSTIFFSLIAATIFFASTVPLSSLHAATNTTISPNVRMVYNRLSKLHIVNQYGLFDKITGINGRPEIIIEGSNNVEGPWVEYNFLYKPGNVNNSLPFVAPYSPRLDWQMWWSAQSTYSNEPWLLSLVHRLLSGNPEVLALLDRHSCPFIEKPPKYIRGVLYTYKYTPWSQRWQSAWWKREKVGEYFPVFSKDSAVLQDTLKARNLLPTVSKQKVHPIWKQVLDSIRMVASQLEATLLMWSVFTAGCAIITTTTKNK